jgi:hypothetical protein
MHISIVQTILSSVLALIVTLFELKDPDTKRFKLWGYTLIFLSLLLVIISVTKIVQEYEIEKNEKYYFEENDISIELKATIVNEYPTEELLSKTPSSMEIGFIIPNEAGWRCLLEPLPDFVYSGYNRGPVVLKRIYITKRTVSIGKSKFKYLWELSGKEIKILRNPKYAFSDISNDNRVKSWEIDLTLIIKGEIFKPENPNAYTVIFSIGDFAKLNNDNL